jgi:hypothetical protein
MHLLYFLTLKRRFYQTKTTDFIKRRKTMNYRNIVSVFSKRLFVVILGVAVLLAMAVAAFATWDAQTNRYNPDGTGHVVAYDSSSCTDNPYINFYHGTTYKDLTKWSGANGTKFNDLISCVIIGPKTKFEYWQHKDYKGKYGVINNTSDQIQTHVISGWWDNSISSVKVWKQ